MIKKITIISLLLIPIYMFFFFAPQKADAYAELEVKIRDTENNPLSSYWAFDYEQGDWGDFSSSGSDGFNYNLTPGGYRPYAPAMSGYTGPLYVPGFQHDYSTSADYVQIDDGGFQLFYIYFARNGGWSNWSAWGDCSVTACGSTGTQTRTRTCTNPSPQVRGAPCSGSASESRTCSTPACTCSNGATNPPACTTCPTNSAMISGTCTPVTVSVSAVTPYNTTPNTNVSFTYTPTTNSGGTQCRLLNFDQSLELKPYQANSPIRYPSANGVGSYGYYVQCRNTAHTAVQAVSNQIIVNTACTTGEAWDGDSCETVVNGGWSEWNPSSCPTACGSPASTLTRTCTNPAPANGGTGCSGSTTQSCPATAACACSNGATNPPACTTCPTNSAMISGTCTAVTVSVSAVTPYNTTPNTNVSFAYTPTTNSGSTQCRLLNFDQSIELKPYQANSPIRYPSANGVGSYGYYVQCRNTAHTSVEGISNQIIVNTACAGGEAWDGDSCETVVDGSWGSWSGWSACSVTACGSAGTQTSTRVCTPPQNGGRPCSEIDGGNSSRTQVCVTSACPCLNGATNPPICTINICQDTTADNFGGPLPCRHDGGGCPNGATNPPACNIGVCEDPAANNLGGPLPCSFYGRGGATIDSDEETIYTGDPVTLTWSSSGAVSCTGTNFDTKGTPSGSVTVNPISTTTYTVTCNGASASKIVTVKKRPFYQED